MMTHNDVLGQYDFLNSTAIDLIHSSAIFDF